jgi:hypothetical protein
LKHTDQQPLVAQISLSTATAFVPPPVRGAGGTGLRICSTAEARDSARWLADFLEGLKDIEIDREGTHSSFTPLSL